MNTKTSQTPSERPVYPVALGASHEIVKRLTDVLAFVTTSERLADRDWRMAILALKDARDVLNAKELAEQAKGGAS